MTDEELDAIEVRGEDPLNSYEDARDGLEQLGADVARLVKELRDERAMCERWKMGERASREALAEARSERDTFAREIAEASERLGGYSGEVPLTGPQILLLLRDIESEVARLRIAHAVGAEGMAERDETIGRLASEAEEERRVAVDARTEMREAREEARLWRALAKAERAVRSSKADPGGEGHDPYPLLEACAAAEVSLRAAGIDPDAP